MNRRYFLLNACFWSLCFILSAQESNASVRPSLWVFSGRVGMHVGASTPVPVPQAMEHVYAWYPRLNPMVQLSASRRLLAGSPWAVNVGIAVEKKGMEATTRVKDMKVAIVSDSPYAGNPDEEYPGLFTGDNNTEIRLSYLTIPVQAEYNMLKDRLKLRGGLYTSLLLESSFRVIIDGTMVYDDPKLGTAQMDLRELNFSDKIKGADFGVIIGADYYFARQIGAFADVTFGLIPLTGTHFKAIPYRMYNVFARIGFSYRLNY